MSFDLAAGSFGFVENPLNFEAYLYEIIVFNFSYLTTLESISLNL